LKIAPTVYKLLSVRECLSLDWPIERQQKIYSKQIS